MPAMKRDRRSYYRILYVQPEAPLEVIRASYRSLMTKLKAHPDLGGDHDTAVAINQAYAVLSDPEKRRAYDASRKGAHKRQGTAAPKPSPEAGQRPGCVFCGAGMPRIISLNSNCQRCGCPLAPIATRLDGWKEPAGRRSTTRVARKDKAMVQPAWNRPASTARLRDLSTNGVSFYTAAVISIGSNIRLTTPNVDLVARVIQVRRQDQICTVQAKVLTARFADQTGVFVSVAV